MTKIAIFSSGQGSTFEHLTKACLNGQIKAQVEILISDRSTSPALNIATQLNVSTKVLPISNFSNFEQWDLALLELLKSRKVDFVVLAGFLKKIGPQVINHYNNKIINTHPSLLPKYGGKGMYGQKVHEAVYQNKDNKTGVTIHYVSSSYDEGQIIVQKEIELEQDITTKEIEELVKAIEKPLVVNTVQQLIDSLTSSH